MNKKILLISLLLLLTGCGKNEAATDNAKLSSEDIQTSWEYYEPDVNEEEKPNFYMANGTAVAVNSMDKDEYDYLTFSSVKKQESTKAVMTYNTLSQYLSSLGLDEKMLKFKREDMNNQNFLVLSYRNTDAPTKATPVDFNTNDGVTTLYIYEEHNEESDKGWILIMPVSLPEHSVIDVKNCIMEDNYLAKQKLNKEE